jgi:hypothetical protein
MPPKPEGMPIFLYLAAMLAECWIFGVAVIIVLQRLLPFSLYRVRAIRFTVPVVGYVFANLIWWVATFRLTLNNSIPLLIMAGIIVIAAIILIKERFRRALVLPLLPARADWPVLIVVVCVAVLGSWPTVAIGMGNYFLYNDSDWFTRVTPAILNHREVADIVRANAGDPNSPFAGNFKFPQIQVSSLMLWELLIGRSSNDCALIQGIVNLVFTAIGAYWLSRFFFGVARYQSALAAFLAVAAQFYFHTFLDGHIGSTIYSSVAPFFFGVGIWALVNDRYRSTLLVIASMWIFMGADYPLVSYLVLLPLIVGKCRLLYLKWEQNIIAALNKPIRNWFTKQRIRLAGVGVAILAAWPLYRFALELFYTNRIGVSLMGYDPMGIVFDQQVLEWFYGLRLTTGFGYGFVDTSINLHSYNVFATVVGAVLTAGVGVGAWRLIWAGRNCSFLSIFLILLPLVAIVFASVYPFSYVVYKILYVHYFLVVIGGVVGFYWLIKESTRRHLWPVTAALWCIIFFVVGLNVTGTIMNGNISLSRLRFVDLADLNSLVVRLKQTHINEVTAHTDGNRLLNGMIQYAVASAGVEFSPGGRVGQTSITPQDFVFSKISSNDIIAKSDRGKYILSNTPGYVVDVSGHVSPEVRNGVVFRWLNTDVDYSAFSFERDIQGFAAYWKSVPSQPIVYNDFSDSGYYLVIDNLLDRYGIAHSDDPRKCTYFMHLSPRLEAAVSAIGDPKSALTGALIAGVDDEPGQRKVVRRAFANDGKQQVRWTGEMLQVVQIPFAGRRMLQPKGMNASQLIRLIRTSRMRVANTIPRAEYERYFLDEQMRLAGSVPVENANATAELVALPEFLIQDAAASDSSFASSILWAGPREDDYSILLVTHAEAKRLRARETAPFWTYPQPLRTLLRPTVVTDFASFEVFARDGDLRLVIGKGPSLMQKSGTIRAVRADGLAEPLFFNITRPSEILTLPIKHFMRPGELSTQIFLEPMLQPEERVMPSDDRILPYLLLGAELSPPGAPLYSENDLRVLRTGLAALRQDDIIDADEYPKLALGAGWYQREKTSGLFRWMSDQADVVFDSEQLRGRVIAITGQPQSAQLTINVRLNGVPVLSQDLQFSALNSQLVFDPNAPRLRQAMREGQNVITLIVGRHAAAIGQPNDPRELDFKVFHIWFADR